MEERYINIPLISLDQTEMLWSDSELGCYYRNRKTAEDEWNYWYKISEKTYNILYMGISTQPIQGE